MSQFYNAILTNEGTQLIAKNVQGVGIAFTKFVTGSGEYSNEEIANLKNATALKHQEQQQGYSNSQTYDASTVKLKTMINNENLTVGYYMREIGVYAKEVGGTEVLFAIAVAQYADWIPPYDGHTPLEITQEFYATVADSANVIIESSQETVALAEDLQAEATLRQQQFDSLNETMGNLQSLQTEDNTSLVNAINEVFTSGNEKKSKLVENLIAMGVTASTSESWESLLAKVLTIFAGTDVSDTTAIAAHVLETDYFYNAQGVKTKGTMIDRSCVNGNELDILNPSYPRQTIHEYTVSAPQYGMWGSNEDKEGVIVPAPSGYFDNVDGGDLSYVYVPASSLRSRLGITADKIVNGNTICGVEGTAVLGKKFASGYIAGVDFSQRKAFYTIGNGVNGQNTNMRYIDVTCDFIPSVILLRCDGDGCKGLDHYVSSIATNLNPRKIDSDLCNVITTDGFYCKIELARTTSVPFCSTSNVTKFKITWYAFE